ncbi:MAG: MATE family efflux transporter [Lentisphaeria bacterium]|nr:MATE family efflux transporter [Lentisphaeria bacterium]
MLSKFFNFLFGDKVFNKKLFTLALPISLQNLMLALVAAADAVMLGKLEQNAMAAVSLATQIQFVQNMFLGAICWGVGVLGAQYWGKKDILFLGRLFGLSIRESLIISVVFFIGCRFFPDKLMKLFASDPVLINIGAEYLRIAAWSYLITGISQCYLAIMRVSEHAVYSAWISSVTVVVNIILNAVLIFGLFGVPAMGVKGAALATLIARIFELCWCIGTTFGKTFIKLKIRMIFSFSRILLLDFWRYTGPILGAFILWGVGFTAYTAIMGHMGCDAAAGNAIAAVVRDLMCCLCNGIAVGSGIIIGNELGAGDLAKGKLYGEKALVMSFVAGIISLCMILCSIPVVLSFIQLTTQAREYMIGMFCIMSFYMIGRCICTVVINGVFSAGGDTMFDPISVLVAMYGVGLPCAFLGAFYFHWPVLVIYGCTCLDEVGKVPWVICHFLKYKWVKNITR